MHKRARLTVVGAGPGDLELITLKAIKALQDADVVLYDALVDTALLEYAFKAERIFVGKRKGCYAFQQDQINELIVQRAQSQGHVVRLKGGDPFVFGRGGEEIEALSENGVTFQVIPGVTAAVGCASYSGIPLTHRDHAQGCMFVTGHEKDGKLNLNWKSLIQPRQTVVVYMGLSSMAAITKGFIANGADPATPAAVIENGTRAGQRVITGTLESLSEQTAVAGIKSPALIIIGGVVTLRDKLSWFANKTREQRNIANG